MVIFCIGSIISSILCLVINTYYTGKLIDVGFLIQMKDLTPILLLSAVMYLAIYCTNSFIENMVLQIIIGGIVGAFIYLGGAFLFRFEELNDVKYMLKRKA